MEFEKGHQTIHPPQFHFPTYDDLRAIIAVEDREGKRLRVLLSDLHLFQMRPLRMIAILLDVDFQKLRLWFTWYGIPMQTFEVLHGDVSLLKSHLQTDVVLERVRRIFRETRSWDLVAKAISATREELLEWMREHRSIVSRQFSEFDLEPLLGEKSHASLQATVSAAEAPQVVSLPSAQREIVKHPSGIQFLREVQDRIDAYCTKHACTERETFTALYNPLKLHETAQLIGIGEGIYSALVLYYNDGTFQKRYFKHESGVVVRLTYTDACKRLCHRMNCSESDLFRKDAESHRIHSIATELDISVEDYATIADYYTTRSTSVLLGG